MQYRFNHKQMHQVADQLQWIADHHYDRYDMPTSQSNGSVAVLKADVTKLLDYVDHADKQGEIDTDGMQLLLNALKPTAEQWADFVTTIHLYIVDKIEKWFADRYLNISTSLRF